MRTIKRTILTGAATLTLAALLSGCSSAGGDLNSLMPSVGQALSAETPAASPAATPTAIPGDTDGNGKLSEFEKQISAMNAVRPYVLPDGSTVQVDPTQPLPEVVVAAIKTAVAPSVSGLMTAGSDPVDQGTAVMNLFNDVSTQAEKTGKDVILVFQTNSSDGLVWGTIASGKKNGLTGINGNASKDAIVAEVQAWATNRNYEVVVAD